MSRKQSKSSWCDLTKQELIILAEVAKGYSNKDLAKKFVIEETTIRAHINHIYSKLGINNQSIKTHSLRLFAALMYLKHIGKLKDWKIKEEEKC